MANWAKLQEDLTGLKVVKRAKYGIHFDKGGGQILANFSGKPCHFLDGKIWKPIDTKLLLLPDGFYGSPHSDVKIHKDGRIKAGGYQQKSALVAAKEGVVDGDKIVREFKFGTQYLYMKEDGFRQETVITRPPTTAEAKHLIASESGELPSKYKRSDITAVDADGAVHEFVNLGQFKKWLDKAVYPVVIDPDFAGDTADGCIWGYHNVYSTANTTMSVSAPVFNSEYTIIGQFIDARSYRCDKSLYLFDTSTIGSSSTVTQANLKLTIYMDASMTDFVMKIIKLDWSALAADPTNDTKAETVYDAFKTATADADFRDTADGVSANTQYTSENLDTTWVSKTGITYYGVASDRDIAGIQPSGNEAVIVHTSEVSTEAYRPVLTVTYEEGAAGVPKHYLHYARLRG